LANETKFLIYKYLYIICQNIRVKIISYQQISFSKKPDEKIFFLGALAGLAKMGAAKAAGRADVSCAKKAESLKLAVIPLKISTGDINIGNKQQEN
jgi:hypothetical protein